MELIIALIFLLELEGRIATIGTPHCKADNNRPDVAGFVEHQANGSNVFWEIPHRISSFPREHLDLYAVCTCIKLGGVDRVTANAVWNDGLVP
jgi:hypothetical protein